jgi:hypothetical protein
MRVFGGSVLARGAPDNRWQQGLVRERGLQFSFAMCNRGVDQRYRIVFCTDQQTEPGTAG